MEITYNIRRKFHARATIDRRIVSHDAYMEKRLDVKVGGASIDRHSESGQIYSHLVETICTVNKMMKIRQNFEDDVEIVVTR